MKDFMLNNSGDIMFATAEELAPSFQFDFFISDNSIMTLNFYIENLKKSKYLKGLTPGLIFDFNISKTENDKEIIYNIDEEEYLYQQLKIRISSVLGTILGNEDIGSTIESYKHKNIDDNLNYILSSVKDAIEDIMPEAILNIRKIGGGYYTYSDSVEITVSNKEYKFYYYL
jgi:hypothetical protein